MTLTAPRRQTAPPVEGGAPDRFSHRGGLAVTVCGSFRRDPAALRFECEELEAEGCHRLSPRDLDFVGANRGFVFAEHERGRPPGEIEDGHLRAMEQADFVWLHSPDGYVGASAAMELGFARAVGIPVFAERLPNDPSLEALVNVVNGPAHAVRLVRSQRPAAASRGLQALQDYYNRVAKERGWAGESATETLDRLRGEVDELADALAEAGAPIRGNESAAEAVGLELADVQLYVVHLANVLEVDLGDVVATKERVNGERFRSRNDTEAA